MASSAGEPPPTRHPDEEGVPSGSGATVRFAELLRAHTRFERAREDPSSLAEASRNYESLLAAFERTHGPIADSFWGEDGMTAAALTGGRRPRLGGLLGRETEPRLHVLSGGLSRAPRASELQHRCEMLAIRASVVLIGASRRIAMQWLFSDVARLLVAELGSAKPERGQAEAVFGHLEADLRKLGEYVDRASERITRLRYFWGVLLGLLIVTIGAAVAEVTTGSISTVDRATAAVTAGALGAAMSVMQQMSAGRIRLDADLDRATIVRLGAFRPLIGAVLGGFVYWLFAAEVVVVLPTGSTSSTSIYTYAFTGFLAGFAERWVRVLFEPSTSLRQEELAERIPAAVEESVRATLLGPVLARWHGFVSASIAGQEAAAGASRVRPLEQAELTIRFAQEETGVASERRIDIREGEEAPEVPFMLRLDSDTVSLPYSEQTMAVPAEGMAATAMSFTAPKAAGLHQLWVRVSQRNRVVQIVPLEFEVVD